MDLFNQLDQGYIKYGIDKIRVLIDNNEELWFNAKDCALTLGYLDSNDAIKKHVDKDDKIRLKKIQIDNRQGHPDTLYISEAGLYSLVLRSRLKSSKKFKYFVTHDVLPSIRKYNKYVFKKQYEDERAYLIEKLQYMEKQYHLARHDLKKEKYPEGALFYVVDYGDKNEEKYRIGITENMNKRKKIYDTHMLHKRDVVIMKEASNPERLEDCVRAMLYDYQYKDDKDFFVCSLSKMRQAVNRCVKDFDLMKKDIISGSKSGVKNIQWGDAPKKFMERMIDKLKYGRTKLDKKIKKLDKELCD